MFINLFRSSLVNGEINTRLLEQSLKNTVEEYKASIIIPIRHRATNNLNNILKNNFYRDLDTLYDEAKSFSFYSSGYYVISHLYKVILFSVVSSVIAQGCLHGYKIPRLLVNKLITYSISEDGGFISSGSDVFSETEQKNIFGSMESLDSNSLASGVINRLDELASKKLDSARSKLKKFGHDKLFEKLCYFSLQINLVVFDNYTDTPSGTEANGEYQKSIDLILEWIQLEKIRSMKPKSFFGAGTMFDQNISLTAESLRFDEGENKLSRKVRIRA